ncbi:MAG: DUF86 domain-containing protein [Candidatus Cloacimonetes bacterium]|nr:DUF86 domain-containing protein [Candidatus Cloacimonadota bacterium]
MTEQGLKFLFDIKEAIKWIEDFTSSIANYDEYLDDKKTQSAVERQLGIIGEAVNKFETIESEINLQYARKIVGFRNRLIHAYDSVDSAIVWAILKRHIDPLKAEVNELISQHDQ